MEAQTILGSLVCFPNLYLQIPILQRVPGSDDIVVGNEDIKVNGQHVPYWMYVVITFIIIHNPNYLENDFILTSKSLVTTNYIRFLQI